VTESGTYYVKAVNGNTCVVVKPIEVEFNDLPKLTITNPTPVCSGKSIDLMAAEVTSNADLTGLQLSYYTDAAATSELTNPTAVTASGPYYVKAVNANTCVVVKPIEVEFNDLPELTITDPTPVCSGESIDLTAAAITGNADLTGLQLSYYIDAAATSELTNPTAVTESGTYYLKAVNANNCVLIKSIEVEFNALPELTITDPTPVCSGESIDLTVAAITSNTDLTGLQLSYYTDAAATSELTDPTAVTESGTYYLKAVNGSECASVLPIVVKFNALPELTITNPTPVCSGESIDLTAAAITSNADLTGLQLSYYTDAAATIELNNPTAVTESGTYYLQAVNANSCVAVYPVEVKFNALPELTIINVLSANGPKTVDLTHPRVTQNADLTGLTLSYWHDALAVAEPIQQPKAITVTGTYYIKAETAYGCSTVDGIAVNMEATNRLYANIDEIVNVSCYGANSGKATLKSLDDENGGILEYQLDNDPWIVYQEESEVVFENLAPGTHL
jgi:roadblock/LC7 domain-containing protein